VVTPGILPSALWAVFASLRRSKFVPDKFVSNLIPLSRDVDSHLQSPHQELKNPRKAGFFNSGAGDGNRTHVVSLGS
jgi:hypothetical protein